MTGKKANFLKAALVGEFCNAFPGGEFGRFVLFVDAFAAASQFQLCAFGMQVGDLLLQILWGIFCLFGHLHPVSWAALRSNGGKALLPCGAILCGAVQGAM